MPADIRTTTQSGAAGGSGLVSLALLQQMLGDIAFCKAAINGGGDSGTPSNAGASNPQPRPKLWLKITDWDGSPDPNVYTCDVYGAPLGGPALVQNVKAKNIWEVNNGAAKGSEYNFTDLDGITIVGVYDVPSAVRHEAIAYLYDADLDQFIYWFSCRQEPKGECPA